MYLVPFDRPILTPATWQFWEENGIWTGLLPHGNGGNTSDRPRVAQYITMDTTPPDEQELRTRINAWQERIPIANPQGDPRGREKRQPVAALTELGRRLIGITPWDQEPAAAAARGGTLPQEVT